MDNDLPTIKFSHQYGKLYYAGTPCKFATLLIVLVVQLETLHKSFTDYDTDKGLFKLPAKGDYLMLIFQKNKHHPNLFTTLRRHTPEKYKYYSALTGQLFNIKIETK